MKRLAIAAIIGVIGAGTRLGAELIVVGLRAFRVAGAKPEVVAEARARALARLRAAAARIEAAVNGPPDPTH
jgi:hypothetical protein